MLSKYVSINKDGQSVILKQFTTITDGYKL